MAAPVTGYLDRSDLGSIAKLLLGGAVVVLPTDTIYGFHCIAADRSAVDRMRAIKGKRRGKGFILLACDLVMVDRLVSRWPGRSREILARIWPAPLTAILPAAPDLTTALAPGGACAVRIPRIEALLRIIRLVRGPLVSTSANRAGEEPIGTIPLIREAFPGLEAYLSRRGGAGGGPSTVVDFRRDTPLLIRAGRYPWPPPGNR